MDVRKFNRLLAIERPVRVADGEGGFTRTWARIGSLIWGNIVSFSAQESFQYDRMEFRATHQIRVRFTADITLDCRLLWGTRYFYVVSLQNVNDSDEELILTCEEKTA